MPDFRLQTAGKILFMFEQAWAARYIIHDMDRFTLAKSSLEFKWTSISQKYYLVS